MARPTATITRIPRRFRLAGEPRAWNWNWSVGWILIAGENPRQVKSCRKVRLISKQPQNSALEMNLLVTPELKFPRPAPNYSGVRPIR